MGQQVDSHVQDGSTKEAREIDFFVGDRVLGRCVREARIFLEALFAPICQRVWSLEGLAPTRVITKQVHFKRFLLESGAGLRPELRDAEWPWEPGDISGCLRWNIKERLTCAVIAWLTSSAATLAAVACSAGRPGGPGVGRMIRFNQTGMASPARKPARLIDRLAD